ncbi:MAG: hypothetical protein E2O74_06125 [Chloroflexi bacterium]|nr:MAG: hypothetical protein E2O74_06125 [Chloroflexota bacterium]
MKIRYALIALLLGSILSVVSPTLAVAKELVKVIVLGPGLNGEVEITDPDQVSFFENLVRLPVIEEKPDGLSDAFFEIRMAVGSAGEIVAYNVYHYYPAQGQVAGYFYYAGVIEGSSSVEGKWFSLAEDGDRALRELLVSLGAAGPLAEGNTAQPSRLPLVMAIGLLLVLILATAAVVWWRKSPIDDQYP